MSKNAKKKKNKTNFNGHSGVDPKVAEVRKALNTIDSSEFASILDEIKADPLITPPKIADLQAFAQGSRQPHNGQLFALHAILTERGAIKVKKTPQNSTSSAPTKNTPNLASDFLTELTLALFNEDGELNEPLVRQLSRSSGLKYKRVADFALSLQPHKTTPSLEGLAIALPNRQVRLRPGENEAIENAFAEIQKGSTPA